MFTEQEIESFLHGNDPEEFIVAIEFDYASNSIYKIKEIPGKGKEIRKDTFISFALFEVSILFLLSIHF